MSKIRGLPTQIKMRHDAHFVDELSVPRAPEPVGRMIELERIDVNPHQPRKDFGDLTDLINSIKEKGLLEPVLVRELEGRFQIIAGERRFHASKAAGLRQIPCIEMEVDERGVLEISLIENLQRRDLNPFEEADGIKSLCDRFDYTHEKVAAKLGKSRTSVTELLAIGGIPEDIRERCRQADISSKSLLVEVARQLSIEDMESFIREVSRANLSRDEARRFKSAPPPVDEQAQEEASAVPVRPYTFRFRSRDRRFSVNVKFEREEVDKKDVISALQDLIREIETSDTLPA